MKNSIIKLMLALTVAFTTFSCSNDGNNDEITKYPTIATIVSSDAQFSILLKALNIAALTNTFTGSGSYTVFAPTNAAFAAYTSTAFPAGINDAVLSGTLTPAQNSELKKVLQYHVLSVGTLSSDLLSAEYSKTFAAGVTSATNGSLSLFVNTVGSDVVINGGATNGGAKVTKADINASNGVVHVIDQVLKLPTLVNFVVANPKLSTLLAVVTSTSGTFGDQTAILTALTAAGSTTATALTVYAPTNDAFTAATTGSGYLTGAAVTGANVTKVLQYHVEGASNRLTNTAGTSFSTSADIVVSTLLTPQKFTILKNLIRIKENSSVAVAANIINSNIQATNGVIHTIDRVLQPTL